MRMPVAVSSAMVPLAMVGPNKKGKPEDNEAALQVDPASPNGTHAVAQASVEPVPMSTPQALCEIRELLDRMDLMQADVMDHSAASSGDLGAENSTFIFSMEKPSALASADTCALSSLPILKGAKAVGGLYTFVWVSDAWTQTNCLRAWPYDPWLQVCHA